MHLELDSQVLSQKVHTGAVSDAMRVEGGGVGVSTKPDTVCSVN